MKIDTIDQLKKQLKKTPKAERLERHALIEVAYAEATNKNIMLTEALKQSQSECAMLRSQLKERVE